MYVVLPPEFDPWRSGDAPTDNSANKPFVSIAIGGSLATIITSAGGEAITLATSGAGVVTTFAGSVYTAATGEIGSLATSGASSLASGATTCVLGVLLNVN